MRQVVLGLTMVLVGCGDPPPCGVDDQGEDVPFCTYEATGDIYCPLDNWIAADDCNTCGCSDEGEVACNDRLECADPTQVTGTTAISR